MPLSGGLFREWPALVQLTSPRVRSAWGRKVDLGAFPNLRTRAVRGKKDPPSWPLCFDVSCGAPPLPEGLLELFFFFFLIAVFLLEWSGLLGFSRTSFSINWGQDRFLALTAWALTCPRAPPFIGEAKTLSPNRSGYFSWGTADPCSDLWLSFDHVQVRKHPRFPVPSFTREKCPLKPRPLT